MKPADVIIGPEVHRTFENLIDYVDPSEIPGVINFLDEIESRLVKTLTTAPEGGSPFQGPLRSFTIRGYTFIYEYVPDLHEVHVHEMKGPGQNWK